MFWTVSMIVMVLATVGVFTWWMILRNARIRKEDHAQMLADFGLEE